MFEAMGRFGVSGIELQVAVQVATAVVRSILPLQEGLKTIDMSTLSSRHAASAPVSC